MAVKQNGETGDHSKVGTLRSVIPNGYISIPLLLPEIASPERYLLCEFAVIDVMNATQSSTLCALYHLATCNYPTDCSSPVDAEVTYRPQQQQQKTSLSPPSFVSFDTPLIESSTPSDSSHIRSSTLSPTLLSARPMSPVSISLNSSSLDSTVTMDSNFAASSTSSESSQCRSAPSSPRSMVSSSSSSPVLPSLGDHSRNEGHLHQTLQNRKKTSYSPQVTRYLKEVFIATAGQNRKLTKKQRQIIMQETGLSSRHLTYWFSNHRRRKPCLCEQYRQAVTESCGQVRTFEDLELWLALSKNANVPN